MEIRLENLYADIRAYSVKRILVYVYFLTTAIFHRQKPRGGISVLCVDCFDKPYEVHVSYRK